MTEELHGLQTHPLYHLLSDIPPHRLRDTDSCFPLSHRRFGGRFAAVFGSLTAISHTLPPLRTFTGTLHWVAPAKGQTVTLRSVTSWPTLS
jgi:hypothetical protein